MKLPESSNSHLSFSGKAVQYHLIAVVGEWDIPKCYNSKHTL